MRSKTSISCVPRRLTLDNPTRQVELSESHNVEESQWKLKSVPITPLNKSSEAQVKEDEKAATKLSEHFPSSAAAEGKQPLNAMTATSEAQVKTAAVLTSAPESDTVPQCTSTSDPLQAAAPSMRANEEDRSKSQGPEERPPHVATSLFPQSSGFRIDSFRSTQSGRDTNMTTINHHHYYYSTATPPPAGHQSSSQN